MSIATKTDREIPSVVTVAKDLVASVGSFFTAIARANMAATAFSQLSHLSDAQLKARGLSREGIGKYVCDTYLAD